MNTKLSLAVAAVLCAAPAFAGEKEPAVPSQIQRQAQVQGQAQGQFQKQESNASSESTSSSSSSANNEGVSQSVSFTSPRQAPSVSAPSVFPTATCQSGFSLGGSNTSGGGVLGLTFTKRQCELFQLSQNLASLGMTQAACEVLNKTKAAERAFGANKPSCEAPQPQEGAPAPAPQPLVIFLDVGKYATKEELDRAIRSALSK